MTSASAKPAAAEKTSSAGSSVKLTAAEKRLLEAYRAADQKTRDAAMAILTPVQEEEAGSPLVSLLSALAGAQNPQAQSTSASGSEGTLLGTLLANAGGASGTPDGNGGSLLGSLLSGMASGTGNSSSTDEGDNSGGGLASLLMGLLK